MVYLRWKKIFYFKLKEQYKKKYDFNTCLEYKKVDYEKNAYYFGSLYSPFENYYITEAELVDCIETIKTPCLKITAKSNEIPEQYVEGIVSAWIIYIFVMVFALFIKGIFGVITTQVVATIIFNKWRKKKKDQL